jgi:DNA-directed RNA polymerase subunit RPC12/RpoP
METDSELGLKTNSEEYNKATSNNQLFHEEVNAIQNYSIIREACKTGRAKDISLWEKEKGPAFILGSGASLDLAIPKLKNWKGGIICTTSHARTLMYHGIQPTHIIALDPFCCWDEIKGIDWSNTKTKLVTVPTVWPTLIENWPNEIILYLQQNGQPNSFYSSTLKRMYSERTQIEGGVPLRESIFHYMIRTEITLFACSPAMELFIAQILGYSPIFTSGCDFAYNFGKYRFTEMIPIFGENDVLLGWEEKVSPLDEVLKQIEECNINIESTIEKAKAEDKPFDIPKKRKLIKTKNGLYSEEVHIYYKKNFYSAWNLCQAQLFSTDHGACIEMPYVDIDDVINNVNMPLPISIEEIEQISEEYLASVNLFVIKTGGGKKFVEAENPEIDIMKYMQIIWNMYRCTKCGAQIKSDDDNDHTNNDCPACHAKESLVRAWDINLEENMNRFRSRIVVSLQLKLEI